MRHRVGLAIISLHISAVLYGLIGAGCLALGLLLDDDEFGIVLGVVMAILCFAMIVGIEVVAWGLARRKFWAWIAGLCIFGVYAPSLFFPLGALGLWGLLDEGSRLQFGVGGPRPLDQIPDALQTANAATGPFQPGLRAGTTSPPPPPPTPPAPPMP